MGVIPIWRLNRRTLDEERRVFGNDLFDHQPVEKATKRRQVLFHGRRA